MKETFPRFGKAAQDSNTGSPIVEPLSDKIWLNCAFYDKSMTFGTHVEYIMTKIFGYRAISDFA